MEGMGSEGMGRLLGAGGAGVGSRPLPPHARPLSLEEVERQAAQAAASQPFV